MLNKLLVLLGKMLSQTQDPGHGITKNEVVSGVKVVGGRIQISSKKYSIRFPEHIQVLMPYQVKIITQ
jgi:hypothetical protein